MKKKIFTKIYQKQNKSVGHQTLTFNARLLHFILGVIYLLLHAKIWNVVDYYELIGRVYLLHTDYLINYKLFTLCKFHNV